MVHCVYWPQWQATLALCYQSPEVSGFCSRHRFNWEVTNQNPKSNCSSGEGSWRSGISHKCWKYENYSTGKQLLIRHGELATATSRDTKRSSKIWSSIYRFEFKFSFPGCTIRFVIVAWQCAFNKPHSHIVHFNSAWLWAST